MPLPKSTIVLSAILAVLILAAAGLTYYQQKRQPVTTEVGQEKNPSTNPSTSPGNSPQPTPIPLKPDDGVKGTYSVSSKGSGPNISQVVFDPLDVQKGQKLTISVTVASQPASADKVTGSLKTDNGQTELTFTRASTSNTGDIWQTSLTLTDSVLYQYILTVKATSGANVTQIVVAPRS